MFSQLLIAQNPHGNDLVIDCKACHLPSAWEIPTKFWEKNPNIEVSRTTGQKLDFNQKRFDHDQTQFPLTGQHVNVNCRDCHGSLKFGEAKTDCNSCHTDLHGMSVGNDCARCHSTNNWLVENISEIHQQNGFPLTGVHLSANCTDCHISDNQLVFNRIGNDCASCHLPDFAGTTRPNHTQAGFSTNCIECHTPTQTGWQTDKVDHGFFPLVKGHAIQDCNACHTGSDWSGLSDNCITCHQQEFTAAQNPNHVAGQFSQNCTDCHTIDPGWSPARFTAHDAAHFPIYTGTHAGAWTSCTDCHQNQSDYRVFQCINCHVNPQTDQEHTGINGYIYQNQACFACHSDGTTTGVFDHNTTQFPLTGAHAGASCTDCHTNGFGPLPTACASCHGDDYTGATNPNHTANGFPQDCAQCHTSVGWSPAQMPNHDQYWPITGAHVPIANDCAQCHINGNFTNTPNTCVGCHQQDYDDVADPKHGANQFSTDCTQCHNNQSWSPSTFDHATVWPITGAHVPIANQCAECHLNGNYSTTPNTCVGCHQADYSATTNPNHAQSGFGTNCTNCHTNQAWLPAQFDHNTVWPITGAHTAASCTDCHINGVYAGTPTTCVGCHQPDFNGAANPNHAQNQFSTDCTQCHNNQSWVPSTFNHATVWPITGAHVPIANQCAECHINGNYSTTPNTCVGCHQADYSATTNPNHAQSGFGTNCTNCHTNQAWIPAQFDHNTVWPITGAHTAANCTDCHINGVYAGTPTTCVGCHQPDFNGAANPNHAQNQFSTDCTQCHNNQSWVPSTFNHATVWPITGAHVPIANQCAECHLNGNYSTTPNTCVGCHQADYSATTNPNHAQSGFSTNCTNCHTNQAWIPAQFDHNTVWPITGAHTAASCTDCHINGVYAGTPTTCVGCHQPDFNGAANPNHAQNQFSTDCTQCHNNQSWVPSTFNHATVWPITGAHVPIANQCAECHLNGNYSTTPNTCVGCHQADYSATTNPNHAQSGFSTNCTNCHTNQAWIPAQFDHNTVWPITGAHTAASCTDCHINGVYAGTPTTCVGCHQPDFNGAANPNHAQNQFSTDCTQCHNNQSWVPSTFNHATVWPITGAHVPIANQCAECHINGNYSTTPNTCVGCHQADYSATTNPNHAQSGFSTNCTNCHTNQAWIPAQFDHNTVWPITGAHTAASCTDCHINGVYAGTPTTCVGCHQPDFNSSANPSHTALNLPTTCNDCHTTAAWEPATFAIHNQFYQLNGAHAAIANNCVACHNGNYSNTPNTCVGCHQSDFNATTNPNHMQSGFPTDCVLCHNETAWAPSSFNHNTIWPLTGAHATVPNCTDCHVGGNFSTTPTDCVGCHQADYNTSANPSHTALNLPTTCNDCHTTAAWEPATFAIHNQFYQLNGAHAAIANSCVACHNGNYNTTPNTCVACHQSDFNATTNPNHVQSGFPTDCVLCHSETAWAPSSFNHNTIWPLTGAHAMVPNCTDCHVGGNFSTTPTDCAGCHQADYNTSANPNHTALNLPTTCNDCHTTAAWEPATFAIHNQFYQLNGAHAAIANNCVACHNGNYNNTPNTCVGCHQPDYNTATDPNHTAASFSTNCTNCHTESAWVPSSFDHNPLWPLLGQHAAVPSCVACHIGENYTTTPTTCVGCHQADYNATTNPNHTQAGFPTNCALCHDPNGWVPSTFDHSTVWPLTGAHVGVSCNQCHINGNYSTTPTTCVGCHQAAYNSTNDPPHLSAGFPNTCQTCHNTSAWQPSSWDHDGMYFPIYSGKHEGEWNTCSQCHTTPGNYSLFNCLNCHAPGPTNADHNGVSGYQYNSNACYACHPDGSD